MKFKVIALLLGSFFISPSVFAQDTFQIGVATASALKIEAVKSAMKEVFPDRIFKIHSFKADSNIASQPVTEKWGLQGARNRITNAKTVGKASPGEAIDFWVSMENYIEKTPQGWIDRAVVVVERSHPREEILKLSESVPFDEKFAIQAMERGKALDVLMKTPPSLIESGFSVTSGEVIHDYYLNEKGIDLPKDNWHGHKDFGGIPRDKLLRDTIVKGLKEIALSLETKKIIDQIHSVSEISAPGESKLKAVGNSSSDRVAKELPQRPPEPLNDETVNSGSGQTRAAKAK